MKVCDVRTNESIEINQLNILAVISRANNMEFPAELIEMHGSLVLTSTHGNLWVDFLGRQRIFEHLKCKGHISASIDPGCIDEWRQVYHRKTDNYSGVAKRIDDLTIGIGDCVTYYMRGRNG